MAKAPVDKPKKTEDKKKSDPKKSSSSVVNVAGQTPAIINIAGSGIKSGFGREDQPGARTKHKHGVDLSYDSWGKKGTPITSIYGSGKVASVKSGNKGVGNQVVIDYGDVQVAYNHLNDYSVKPGDTVDPSKAFGTMGATGNSPSGSHISYEFRRDGKVVPANVAFPSAVFPKDQWGGKEGSWGDITEFDRSTATSRSSSFSTGLSGASSFSGQQVNLSALGQPAMRQTRRAFSGVGRVSQVQSPKSFSVTTPSTNPKIGSI
jgi:murein DD-endopeptidase MepM/ murein hydrolase activator NlpD